MTFSNSLLFKLSIDSLLKNYFRLKILSLMKVNLDIDVIKLIKYTSLNHKPWSEEYIKLWHLDRVRKGIEVVITGIKYLLGRISGNSFSQFVVNGELIIIIFSCYQNIPDRYSLWIFLGWWMTIFLFWAKHMMSVFEDLFIFFLNRLMNDITLFFFFNSYQRNFLLIWINSISPFFLFLLRLPLDIT